MAVFIGKKSRVLVQGITGKQGSFHCKKMLEYGTKIVSGVTPGKQGKKIAGIPVFGSVKEAVKKTGPVDWSVLFVPAKFFLEAATEALSQGLNLVTVTEHVPVHDAIKAIGLAKKNGKILIGPNTPGIIVPGQTKLGIMPQEYFSNGSIGVVSRSGTLTYEIVSQLSRAGLGQSTVVGIGGDKVTGLGFKEVLKEFEKDPRTKAIVLIGEIGGTGEEEAAGFIKKRVSKPVIAFIAGTSAPKNKTLGHAGAIIQQGKGTAKSKILALKNAGAAVAESPSMVAEKARIALFK